jgi:hypothetical protein
VLVMQGTNEISKRPSWPYFFSQAESLPVNETGAGNSRGVRQRSSRR